jgi:4-hydroxy-tetrahydrodipicolinate synthase
MLTGSMVALVTPMNADGQVDYADLGRLIDFHCEAGTEALVIAGTTGESATLGHDEHVEVLSRSCEFAGDRIPIIAGTGSNSTAQTLKLSSEAAALPIVALLVVTPYYNKPTQEGLYRHYCAIADAVDLPMILYNVPARTAVDMLPSTVARLASHPNVASIKEATGQVDRVAVLRDSCGPDFTLLSGDDGTCAEFMLAGGDGVISVTANVAPAAMRALCDSARAGDRAAALGIDATLQPLHRDLFIESNPIPVKWAVQQMGFAGPGIRLPLTPLEAGHQDAVRSAMVTAGVAAH